MANLGILPAALLISFALVAGGCKEDAPPAKPKGMDAWFPIRLGKVDVKMQVAVRSFEQQQGLMHRAMLGDDEAMIFVYGDTSGRSFWMRDTLIPLDIGFFDRDGVLREVHAMNPLDENPVTSVSDSIQFAVETNQGWYRNHGVKPGAALDLAALKKALTARGFDPLKLGLH